MKLKDINANPLLSDSVLKSIGFDTRKTSNGFTEFILSNEYDSYRFLSFSLSGEERLFDLLEDISVNCNKEYLEVFISSLTMKGYVISRYVDQ